MNTNSREKPGARKRKKSSSVLKVNKFEYPQMAMNLVAHICEAPDTISLWGHYERLQAIADNLDSEKTIEKYGEINRHILQNLATRIRYGVIWDIDDFLVKSGGSVLEIAVGGGYSSGKSSLLNMLTGIGDALPTGVEPVSLVNTFLHCRKDMTGLYVKGRNFKNNLVALDPEVLQSIKHSSSSNVSSVLNDLILEIGVQDKTYLDNVTFVDTPGYNNSDIKNKENDKTDEQTALQALNKSDLVFWCIDIEAGTISNSDLSILKRINKPWVLIFTKIDKKPESERHNVIKAAAEVCKKQLTNQPINILGIAPDRPEIKPLVLNPQSGYLKQIIENKKIELGTVDIESSFVQKFDELISEDIEISQDWLTKRKEYLKELIADISDQFKYLQETKKRVKSNKKIFDDFYITHYGHLLNTIDRYGDIVIEAANEWTAALDREVEWLDKMNFFKNADSLLAARGRSIDKWNSMTFHPDYTTVSEETRRNNLNYVHSLEDRDIEDSQKIYDNLEERKTEVEQSIDREEKFLAFLNYTKHEVASAIQQAFRNAKNQMDVYKKGLKGISYEPCKMDIFTAIKLGNMEGVLDCCSQGVDINSSNAEGFSPLTYAAYCGNGEFLRLFIDKGLDQGIDIDTQDQRGYNVLETAVMAHHRNIIKMLIEADDSLIDASRPLDEVASKNDFHAWLDKNVN